MLAAQCGASRLCLLDSLVKDEPRPPHALTVYTIRTCCTHSGLKGGIYRFDPDVTPSQVFSRFFGTGNPYEALDAISAQFEAMTTTEAPKQGKNKVYTVELSLEEIYFGCLKKVTHKRKVLLENGEYFEEPRTLTIDVKPGLPSGTRFVFEGCVCQGLGDLSDRLPANEDKRLTVVWVGCAVRIRLWPSTHRFNVAHVCSQNIHTFPAEIVWRWLAPHLAWRREGNKTPRKEPGPVVFVLKPLPHKRFQRRGADLVHKVTLPLYQALVGTSIELQTLDSRVLQIPIADVVTPGFSQVVPGEGMPKPTGGKGNLILEVDLLFPVSITETQKMLIKSAFFLPAVPTKEQNKALRAYEAAFKDPLTGWSTALPKDASKEAAAAVAGQRQ